MVTELKKIGVIGIIHFHIGFLSSHVVVKLSTITLIVIIGVLRKRCWGEGGFLRDHHKNYGQKVTNSNSSLKL